MTPRERLFALEQFGIKLGLDNITAIARALGRPDRAYPSVHVGGTNGKGSVTAMVERGLRAAGHRTGRYTSPHLVAIEERIAIDGLPVDSGLFDDVTEGVLALVDQLIEHGTLSHPPTFFEVTTAMAFAIFKRAGVTAAVIEVGLGGRFDATNVIAPALTAITSIDFDHERHLGSTLTEIAYEKAGIIKPHTPVIIGVMAAEAHDVIASVARERSAPLVVAAAGEHGSAVTLALNGHHQHANAAIAVEILRRCDFARTPTRPADDEAQLPRALSRAHIVTALTDVEWPARLEWLRVPACGDLLLDAAHNPAGARALAAYVLTECAPLPMVIGVVRDKDVDAIVRALAPAVSRFVATTATSARAMPADELAARIRNVAPTTPCEWSASAYEAVTIACRHHSRAVIAGSIFLVGPLRAELVARGGVPVRYPSKASPFFLN